jgi:hydroxymethylbilane synthase
MQLNQIRVGTRGSKLALIQTQYVTDALRALDPTLKIETIVIKTEGDKNMAPVPLGSIGKAWFTAELDRAIIDGDIDLAVHSLKDLPITLEPELQIAVVLTRDDPRDVLVSKSGATLMHLPKHAIVGTDSTRRSVLIRHLRPDLKVESLRGNVQTRLRKLSEENYDAIVLAAAGLNRLGEQGRVAEYFDPTTFVPSIGQGTLAVKLRRDSNQLLRLLQSTQDANTILAAEAERAFSATIGGGCKMPIGCYATIREGRIYLYGMVADMKSPRICFREASGTAESGTSLAEALANELVAKCGFEINAA